MGQLVAMQPKVDESLLTPSPQAAHLLDVVQQGLGPPDVDVTISRSDPVVVIQRYDTVILCFNRKGTLFPFAKQVNGRVRLVGKLSFDMKGFRLLNIEGQAVLAEFAERWIGDMFQEGVGA